MSSISQNELDRIRNSVRDIPDFPNKGILFKDITPILEDPTLFSLAIEAYANYIRQYTNVSRLVAIESRGFIFASALSLKLNIGISLLRKPGKLPYKKERLEYDLEYGADALEIHQDTIPRNSNVVIIDDLLATGGTALAAKDLITKVGGSVVACIFLIELLDLLGKERIEKNSDVKIHSILRY